MFKKGEELNYVGPDFDSNYGGSLVEEQENPKYTIKFKKRGTDYEDKEYIGVAVYKEGELIMNNWMGLPEYFERKHHESVKIISENYGI